ncbi:MAG TPA: hypothetical protein VFU54_06025 [Actinomycetota bacterium]|nr:hypothetical protein [Actinomycetota bacterium]
MVRAAFALVVLFAAVAATGSASAAAPFVPRTRPDLVVEVTVNPAEVPPAGGNVQVAIIVGNVGSGPADGVTVKLRPPAGSSLVGDPEVPPMPLAGAAAEDTPSWHCDYTVWRCSYGTLAGGGEAETLTVPLRLPAGSVGDAATVSATATTSSHETATTNNTDRARVTWTAVADLAVELTADSWTDVSNLGGRAYAFVRVTNVGTAEVADVRLTIDPPSGAWVQLENFTTDEWHCDVNGTPWVCTRGALAPAAFAYLSIPVMFPAGTTGDTTTMTATASTTTPERSLANNGSQVTFRYITPEPADVTITGMDAYPPQVVAGDQVTLYIAVDNIGGSPADNVTVRLPLADTVEPVSADGGGDWTCSVGRDADSGQRVWECVHPRYEPAGLELVSPIWLVATVGAGTPEGTVTFTATARTDSPEPSTDNNTGQASTTYLAQGFISGRVWLDQDRDGQRDPDEPAVENGGDGVRSLLLMLEGLIYPAWDTPNAFVGHDGSYTQPLAPRRYFVRVNVSPALDYTTPNTGDEATDSDVVFTARAYDGVTAESAVVDVVDGQHTVVDIGLVPAQP